MVDSAALIAAVAAIEAPIIAEDDEGIRPAGKPDECFYCRRKVGRRHTRACVMVDARRTYRIIRDGRDIGTWEVDEPACWDAHERAFHKNESSWCANNMKHDGEIHLEGGEAPLAFDPEGSDTCTLCSHLTLVPIGESGPGREDTKRIGDLLDAGEGVME